MKEGPEKTEEAVLAVGMAMDLEQNWTDGVVQVRRNNINVILRAIKLGHLTIKSRVIVLCFLLPSTPHTKLVQLP